MTATRFFGTAVQNKRNRQVNVIARTETSNLDAVRQGTEGAVSPATATILGDMLIERVCQVRDAIDVRPGKGVGQVPGVNVRVRERALDVVVDSVGADLCVCVCVRGSVL